MQNLSGSPGRLIAPVLLLCASVTQAAGLNDTGIISCGGYNTSAATCTDVAGDSGTYPRQDARYGRDAAAASGVLTKVGDGDAGFDFTALDANGNPTTPVSYGTTPHPCVRDNVTGLVWEVKTADGGLRDWNWTYSWYDSVHKYFGDPGTANSGTCKTAGRCDTEKYVADVNKTKLCGFSDWRMPTVKELLGIVHLGKQNPSIDTVYFPNTLASSFWSGSHYAGNSYSAWNVYFYKGYSYYPYQGGTYGVVETTGSNAVRLVRSGQ